MGSYWRANGAKSGQAQLYPKDPKQFRELSVGQAVFLKTIPKRKYKYHLDKKEYSLSKKLQFRFTGPYLITRKLSPVVYEIQKETKLEIVSIMNLKPT